MQFQQFVSEKGLDYFAWSYSVTAFVKSPLATNAVVNIQFSLIDF